MHTEKLELLFKNFPLLFSTISMLNGPPFTWMIGGSACLFLLGNERMPKDIDIFLLDDEHDAIDELLNIKSFEYKSSSETVRNSNPKNDHSIQITSHLVITIPPKAYRFSISDEMVEQRIKTEYGGHTIWLMPPEDVLLIKAILQRSKDEGKNDVEDIQKFQALYSLRKDYLKMRIEEIGARERVKNIL